LAAVAGFADAGGVLGLVEGDLDGPATGVPFDHSRDRGGHVRGDQGEGGSAGFDDDQHPNRAGAEDAAPQASFVVNRDGGGAAVAGDSDRRRGHRGGQLVGGADAGAVDAGAAASAQPRRVIEVGMDVPEAGVAA
jgi:hypothetical protein